MPAGRPTFWTPQNISLLRWLSRDGLTQTQIAERLGIPRRKLERHLAAFPELRKAIMDGRNCVDYTVEDTLLRRALGYEIEEVTKDGDGIVLKTVTKQLAPDVTAMIFWLKCRKRQEWGQDKDGNAPPPPKALPAVDVYQLSDEDALKLFELLRRATLPATSKKLREFSADAPVPVEAVTLDRPSPLPAQRGRGRPRKELSPPTPSDMEAIGDSVDS